MAKRINISQLRSKLRQIESQRRQAIARYNQKVRKYNQSLCDLRAAIDRYNREVRSYNARRRQHYQRLQTELTRLRSRTSTRHAEFRASVNHLHETYTRLERSASTRTLSSVENYFLDLSEREAANSLGVLNALDADQLPEEQAEFQRTAITDEVAVISEDLDARWRGALFALNPQNPEAARHFCTSAREIFVEILELKAPDDAVFAAMPNCQRTDRGNATRRSKMSYLFAQKGVGLAELADFANDDIGNVMELFELLNSATHGTAGRFNLPALGAIKRRVEDGLVFLSRLAV